MGKTSAVLVGSVKSAWAFARAADWMSSLVTSSLYCAFFKLYLAEEYGLPDGQLLGPFLILMAALTFLGAWLSVHDEAMFMRAYRPLKLWFDATEKRYAESKEREKEAERQRRLEEEAKRAFEGAEAIRKKRLKDLTGK